MVIVLDKKFTVNINEYNIITLFLFSSVHLALRRYMMMVGNQKMLLLVDFAEDVFDRKRELSEENMAKFQQMLYDIINEWGIDEWKRMVLRP